MDLFQMIRRMNDTDSVISTIDSSNINMTGKNHQNLLHEAIAFNKSNIGIELIKRNIDVNCQDNKGMTSLHYTAWYHSPELAELILKHGGDLSIRDKYGNTALWYAVFHAKGRQYDLVDLLMKAGADPFSKNTHGKSPYDFSSQINDSHLIELLTKENKG